MRRWIRERLEDWRCRRYFGPGYLVPRGQTLSRRKYRRLYETLRDKASTGGEHEA